MPDMNSLQLPPEREPSGEPEGMQDLRTELERLQQELGEHLATQEAKGIKVTATDLENGETSEAIIRPGQHVLICADPCYLDGEQHYGNGTVILTLKRRG